MRELGCVRSRRSDWTLKALKREIKPLRLDLLGRP